MSQLTELVKESDESKILLESFSKRERIHEGTPVNIRRLFYSMRKQYPSLDRKRFEAVFIALERFGYGRITKTRYGNLDTFKPTKSILEIGLEAYPENAKAKQVLPKPEYLRPMSPAPQTKIIVLFDINGKRCRAELPEEVLPEFERRIHG